MLTKVGSFAARTTTGQQTITGIGFVPKLVLFWGTDLTADGTIGSNSSMFRGAAVSPSSRFAVAYTDSNSVNAGRQDNTKCIALQGSGSATILLAADLVSFDAGAFTINVTTTNASAFIVNYMVLGGIDLTAFIKQIQAPAATGSQATTGVGFQPDAMIIMTNGSATAPPTSPAQGNMGLGFGIDSTHRATHAFAPNARRQIKTKVITVVNSAGTLTAEADLTSMDVDGFTLNWSTTLNNMYAWVICLKGGQYSVGSDTQKTSTGTKANTGPGFLPTGLILTSFCIVASASTNTTSSAQSFGAGSAASARGLVALADDNGSNSDEWLDRANIIQTVDNTATTYGLADLSSLDATGFTLNWSVAEATAREFLYMAFGKSTIGSMGFSQNKLRPHIFQGGIAR